MNIVVVISDLELVENHSYLDFSKIVKNHELTPWVFFREKYFLSDIDVHGVQEGVFGSGEFISAISFPIGCVVFEIPPFWCSNLVKRTLQKLINYGSDHETGHIFEFGRSKYVYMDTSNFQIRNFSPSISTISSFQRRLEC